MYTIFDSICEYNFLVSQYFNIPLCNLFLAFIDQHNTCHQYFFVFHLNQRQICNYDWISYSGICSTNICLPIMDLWSTEHDSHSKVFLWLFQKNLKMFEARTCHEKETALLSQCLELTRDVIKIGQHFSISVKLSNEFNFYFSKIKKKEVPPMMKLK